VAQMFTFFALLQHRVLALNGFTAGLTWNATVTAAFKKFAEFFNDRGLVVDYKYFYF